MPSPFPGMDPYLESPQIWPDVQHGLISECQAALNAMLRPGYHVRIEERVYVSDLADPGRRVIVPDLQVSATRAAAGARRTPPDVTSDAANVAMAEPILVTTIMDEEIHESRLEIIDSANRAVVTVMEIRSPANKVCGSRGRRSFEQKRAEVLNSSSHFVEIDLLREGEPIWTRESLPAHDYCIHVSRTTDRPRGLVWPILLTQALPVIGIPLHPQDAEARLDLGEILKTVYERAAYDLIIDYTEPPIVPLPPHYQEWSRNQINRQNEERNRAMLEAIARSERRDDEPT